MLLTNTINILGPILVSQQAVARFGPQAIAVMVVVLTLGTIVFSEIIPKAVGHRHATTTSRFAAPFLQFVAVALYPLVRALEWLAGRFSGGTRRIGTEEQIRALVAMGGRAGYIESDEMRLIRRTFVLNDRAAAGIMTPLESVSSFSADASIAECVTEARARGFSRSPVFGEDPDDVRGVALARELLEALADGRGGEPVLSVARPALEVDASVPADDLLRLFRDQRQHLAVVRENGKTLGIVTFEDVVEELVGEIEDEKDAENP